MTRDTPWQGKFVDDLYPRNKSHPPVLVVNVPTQEQFIQVCTVINQEEFLKVRTPAPRYKRIEINSFSDQEEVDPGVVDYSTCRLNQRLRVIEPTDETITKIRNAPFWSIMFIHAREGFKEKDKMQIAVEKDTDHVLIRCLEEAKK